MPWRYSYCKVVAIIPAFNEAKTIEAVVSESSKYVDEVIVIDDGSTDNTAGLAIKAGAQVYQHFKNLCYGEALKTGLQIALQRGARAAVILDGDGQHNPIYIPSLLQPVLNGQADVVIASRFIKHSNCIPFIRRKGIALVNFIFNNVNKTAFTDTQSGFRAISLRVMLPDLREKGMGISVEFLAKGIKAGLVFKDESVPCNFDNSRSFVFKLIYQGLTVIRSILKYRPNNLLDCTNSSVFTLDRGK